MAEVPPSPPVTTEQILDKIVKRKAEVDELIAKEDELELNRSRLFKIKLAQDIMEMAQITQDKMNVATPEIREIVGRNLNLAEIRESCLSLLEDVVVSQEEVDARVQEALRNARDEMEN